MTAIKDDLIRNNNTINWIPETIGTGRFGAWQEEGLKRIFSLCFDDFE